MKTYSVIDIKNSINNPPRVTEKYKGTRMYYLFGFFIGVLSNLLAMFSKEYSSNIFIFEKTN